MIGCDGKVTLFAVEEVDMAVANVVFASKRQQVTGIVITTDQICSFSLCTWLESQEGESKEGGRSRIGSAIGHPSG